MPRKRKRPLGPAPILSPQTLQVIPPRYHAWLEKNQKARANAGKEWVPVPPEGQQVPWKALPVEVQAALVWAFLSAGPKDWKAAYHLKERLKTGYSSPEECVEIENRFWMAEYLHGVWPDVPESQLDRAIGAFFSKTEHTLRRARMEMAKQMVEFEAFAANNLSDEFRYWQAFLYLNQPFCAPPSPPFQKWLLDVGFGAREYRGPLMGRVIVVGDRYLVQKRVFPHPQGWRYGFTVYRTENGDETDQLLEMLKEIQFLSETQIGDLPSKYLEGDIYGIGGQSHPLQDLTRLVEEAQQSLQRQLVMPDHDLDSMRDRSAAALHAHVFRKL